MSVSLRRRVVRALGNLDDQYKAEQLEWSAEMVTDDMLLYCSEVEGESRAQIVIIVREWQAHERKKEKLRAAKGIPLAPPTEAESFDRQVHEATLREHWRSVQPIAAGLSLLFIFSVLAWLLINARC